MPRVELSNLKWMLACVQDKYPNRLSDGCSSSSQTSILGKRARIEEKEYEREILLQKELNEIEDMNTRMQASLQTFFDAAITTNRSTRDDEYNSGVRDAYEKMAAELPELRRKFRKEGWFMALKALNLNPDKVGLRRGPPYDNSPVNLDDSDSSANEDED